MTLPTNRLAQEKSPYLLQHAHNPVDWYPWGEDAFVKARTENKPIFLSIGYSTCHWCHVMEHESFESVEIARLLNDHFVPIKVDREERPDVDQIYMAFVQATTGHGGWPMSVWLTPELKPFYGGTYFGTVDYPNRPSFFTILSQIARAWKEQQSMILDKARSLTAALQETEEELDAKKEAISASKLLPLVVGIYSRMFDPEEGGFGAAPKFPRPVNLQILLTIAALKSTPRAQADSALGMVLHTLRKMARGGMYDHLGGGFHRYSVDGQWHVPHFEKMLYDQAQLVPCYLAAFQLTRETNFADVAQDVLRYVVDDLTDSLGGFYSAEDADSLPTPKETKKKEGAFYVWTYERVKETLGEDRAKEFSEIYDIRSEGNVDTHLDPHGDLAGQNILIQRQNLDDVAHELGSDVPNLQLNLREARAALLARRGLRPRPHLDDKILTAWNGLMLGAFARAYLVLQQATYLHQAIKNAEFIRAHLYDETTGELRRSYRQGPSNIAGFAVDYAFLISGLLDLYAASTDLSWLRWAGELQTKMDTLFWDEKHGGGYYSTTTGDASLLVRMKEDYDGAEPTPNSVAAHNLWRLGQLLHDETLLEHSRRTVAAFGPRLLAQPVMLPYLAMTALLQEATPVQLILHSPSADHPLLAALLREAHARYLPQMSVIVLATPEAHDYFAPRHPVIANLPKDVLEPTAYLCENFTCQLPVKTPEALGELIAKL